MTNKRRDRHTAADLSTIRRVRLHRHVTMLRRYGDQERVVAGV
jgi:hypothetical protein